MGPVRPFLYQIILVIVEPEQVTPEMLQQAVELVLETVVVFPINCQDLTTQQHCGDESRHKQGLSTISVPEISLFSKLTKTYTAGAGVVQTSSKLPLSPELPCR